MTTASVCTIFAFLLPGWVAAIDDEPAPLSPALLPLNPPLEAIDDQLLDPHLGRGARGAAAFCAWTRVWVT